MDGNGRKDKTQKEKHTHTAHMVFGAERRNIKNISVLI